MATTAKAPAKKAGKKIVKSPKKSAPKQPEVKPLDRYLDWELTTSPHNPELVRFGCGAVTVNRNDLLLAADFIEGGSVSKKVQAVREECQRQGFDPTYDKVSSEAVSERIKQLQDEIKQLQDEIKLLERRQKFIEKNHKQLAFFRLYQNCRNNFSYERLIQVKPNTLRRIAATPKDRTDC